MVVAHNTSVRDNFQRTSGALYMSASTQQSTEQNDDLRTAEASRLGLFFSLLAASLVALSTGCDLAGAQKLLTAPSVWGFMAPLVGGPTPRTGRDILTAFLLYLEEIGYKAAGRPIELLIEDDEAIPAVGLTKARKLVERDNVHLMTGLCCLRPVCPGSNIDSMQIPMLYPVVLSGRSRRETKQMDCSHGGVSASQPNHAFGEYAHRKPEAQERCNHCPLDYRFGWESVGGFQRTFEAEGGTIVQKIWCPVSVHDFAPYLAQISRNVDAVYALFLGRSALQFMRQYEEFGLKERVLLIGSGTTTDEHVLPFMGDEAIGVISALHYSRRGYAGEQKVRAHTGPAIGKCRATMLKACTRAQSGS